MPSRPRSATLGHMNSPVVSTSYGQLEGGREGPIAVFRGIPFATPPVGPLRFHAPQPPAPWDGVRNASAYGPSAMQPITPSATGIGITTIPGPVGEDCLYLNVWTPSTSGKRPVMVWIHGGAFVAGSGSQALYEGAKLAERGDLVVVTVNYRMGVFGYFAGQSIFGEAIPASGNEGTLDQVAALRWVRSEIAAFGGDPENVTVFGESAGSISVAALLGTPAAQGLYAKAILQSGAANFVDPHERAERVARTFTEAAGVAESDPARLYALSAEELLEVQVALTAPPAVTGVPPAWGEGVVWGPTVDGEVIPRPPLDAVVAGGQAGIPLIIGTTEDEMKLFTAASPAYWTMTAETLPAWVASVAPDRVESLIATYTEARAARDASVAPNELYAAIATDGAFRAGAMQLAAAQSAHAPVYAYLFTWKSPLLNGALGAPHAIDLPFTFGNTDIQGMELFVGKGEGVAILSGQVMDAWAAFAHTGDPRHEGFPDWPLYASPQRATMVLGAACAVVDDPLGAELAAWDD